MCQYDASIPFLYQLLRSLFNELSDFNIIKKREKKMKKNAVEDPDPINKKYRIRQSKNYRIRRLTAPLLFAFIRDNTLWLHCFNTVRITAGMESRRLTVAFTDSR